MSYLTENLNKEKSNKSDEVLETIILKAKRAPVIVLFILLLIFIACAIIPIASFFMILLSDTDFHFGVVIMIVVFWGGAFYLLRLILWNFYGKEQISIFKDRISYFADYKYFKDARKEIKVDDIQCVIILGPETKESLGTLLFKNKDETIETVIDIPENELDLICDKISRYFPQTNKKL